MTSAVVLTKNEEENIAKCLKSIKNFDEIILIDDYSVDHTIKIARRFGVKVYKRKLDNDFAGQRNFGLSKAKGDWILFLDADETVSKFLRKEVLLKTRNIKHNAFYLKRRDCFLGKEMKYGETGNIKLLRLARKNCGKWKRAVHEYWDVDGKIGELEYPIIHNKNRNFSDFINAINSYSNIHAGELNKEGKRSSLLKIIIWPIGKFMQNYFFRLGCLDGIQGFIMAIMMSFHSFLAWSKLWIS